MRYVDNIFNCSDDIKKKRADKLSVLLRVPALIDKDTDPLLQAAWLLIRGLYLIIPVPHHTLERDSSAYLMWGDSFTNLSADIYDREDVWHRLQLLLNVGD